MANSSTCQGDQFPSISRQYCISKRRKRKHTRIHQSSHGRNNVETATRHRVFVIAMETKIKNVHATEIPQPRCDQVTISLRQGHVRRRIQQIPTPATKKRIINKYEQTQISVLHIAENNIIAIGTSFMKR